MVSADDGLGLKRRKAPAIMGVDAQKEAAGVDELLSVSYTHLTLPTILRV